MTTPEAEGPDDRRCHADYRDSAGLISSKGSMHSSSHPALLTAYVSAMCPIPAGSFTMGSDKYEDEKPAHRVTLSAFRMGATPVTVGMWEEYSNATGTKMPGAPGWDWIDDHPMVFVSWNDILGSDGNGGYCAWASGVAGFRLTLPTEAQWEYAARGGQDGLEYPWGNPFGRAKLWWSKGEYADAGGTAPVFRRSNIHRNAYGLTDMVGNVDEWCSDWYGLYDAIPATNPSGPESGEGRCLRGGSWDVFDPDYFRCATRDGLRPDRKDDDIGFRLCAEPF